jgi:hypothetical protein
LYLRKNLIYKLLEDEDLRDEWTGYLNAMVGESAYQIAEAEVGIKEALQMELTEQIEMDSLLRLIEFDAQRCL